jgi:hypothetical protein
VAVDADALQAVRIFVTVPRAAVSAENTPLRFIATAPAEDTPIAVDTVFLGPKP